MKDPMQTNTEEMLTFSFPKEDGTEMECEIITVLTVGDKDYVALLPLDGEEADEGDVFFYRYYEYEDRDPEIEDIESDEEFDAVADAFEEYLDTLDFDDLMDEDEDSSLDEEKK